MAKMDFMEQIPVWLAAAVAAAGVTAYADELVVRPQPPAPATLIPEQVPPTLH